VNTLATMEANFDILFPDSGSCIHDQCRREMYTWIGAPIEIVTLLPVIVVLPIRWGLCGILSGLRRQHILISNDLKLVAIRALDTLGSDNIYLSWLILWVSLWALIYIMIPFTTPKANPLGKGY
jgi:hypothetical protein